MKKQQKTPLFPPKWVERDEYALEYWNTIQPELMEMNLLGSDLADIGALCLEWSTYRQASEKLATEGLVEAGSTKNRVPSAWLKIRDAASANIERLLQRVGLDAGHRYTLRRTLER